MDIDGILWSNGVPMPVGLSVLEFRIFEPSPGGVPELGPKKH